jgi:hypothetical protein
LRREVEDDVRPRFVDRAPDTSRIAEVEVEIDRAVVRAARGDRRVATFAQFPAEVLPDEPVAAGDESPHV